MKVSLSVPIQAPEICSVESDAVPEPAVLESFEICDTPAVTPRPTMNEGALPYFRPALGAVGSAVAIVAFDHLVVGSLVDAGVLPKEARVPASFGGVMGGFWLFQKMGLTEVGPIESLRSLPLLMGLQTVVNFVMFDGLKLKPGFSTQAASLAIASAPMVFAQRSPALAAALSGGSDSLALGLGANFAKILGWAGIIDMASGAGLWALGRYEASGTGDSYDDNVRLWDLIRLSQFLFNQERYGATVASTFGNIFTAMDGLHQFIGDDYGAYGQERVAEIQDQLVAGSDEFGRAMNDQILRVVAKRVDASGGSVDWEAVRTDVREFYGREENSKNIGTGYDFVLNYTAPLTQSGIADLVEVVGRDGEIPDMESFQAYVHSRFALKRAREMPDLQQEAEYLGLMDETKVITIPPDPTPEQKDLLIKIAASNSLEKITRKETL